MERKKLDMLSTRLKMKLLKGKYGVCRLDKNETIPIWAQNSDFYSITKTSEELSVVCIQKQIPEHVKFESDWRIFKIEGPLDFSLIGILSSISSLLAKNKISIFAISTYDTDYILVKDKDVTNAVKVLSKENYEIIE